MNATPSSALSPREFRQAVREGRHTGPTSGYCPGHVQANVVILPQRQAWDFLLFCQRNRKPLPLLEVYDPGDVEAKRFAPGSDIRTDCPEYVVLEKGKTKSVSSIENFWRDDLVTFLIGCSFSFEASMLSMGVPVRHMEMGCNVPMYRTNVAMDPAGIFSGPMVVSMRPVHATLISKAVAATERYPAVHGAPVCVGQPQALGIKDINTPDYGDPVEIREDELPLFWACGVSGLSALTHSGVDFAITHAPGHMLVCDPKDEDLAG